MKFAERVETLTELRIAPGYWLVRYHLSAPAVPAMIQWREHEPGDPANRMDRGYWAATIAGSDCDPYEVVACKDRRDITEAEYRFRMAERAWANEWSPEDAAAAHPKRRADLTKIPPLF